MSAREDGPFLRGGQPINEGAQAMWHLKRVHSKTGPLDGTLMAEATRMPHDVTDQTTVLWKSDDSKGSNNIFAKSKIDLEGFRALERYFLRYPSALMGTGCPTLLFPLCFCYFLGF